MRFNTSLLLSFSVLTTLWGNFAHAKTADCLVVPRNATVQERNRIEKMFVDRVAVCIVDTTGCLIIPPKASPADVRRMEARFQNGEARCLRYSDGRDLIAPPVVGTHCRVQTYNYSNGAAAYLACSEERWKEGAWEKYRVRSGPMYEDKGPYQGLTPSNAKGRPWALKFIMTF